MKIIKKLVSIISLLIIFLAFPLEVFGADEKYIWEKPVSVNIGGEADSLKLKLNNEVQKLVDAGHMEPAYYFGGITPGLLFWGYPGEQIYILSQALPYLSSSLQDQVKTFLQAENQAHPPETVGFTYNNDSGWGGDVLDGNRREFYPIDWNIELNIWPPTEVPLEGLFMLWKYADQTGDWQYISNNWNELISLYNSKSGSVDSYGGIAGLIGMARMAKEMGNNSIKDDAVSKANNALDNSNYLTYVNNTESRFDNMMHDWDYPVFCFTRQSNAIGCFFTEEIGRFLHDNHLNDVHESVDFYIGDTSDSYPDSLLPAWFIYRGDYEYHEWRLGNHRDYNSRGEYLGGENTFRPPDIAWTFFMIRAYIFKDDGSALNRFVDIPSCNGDLYHIQKLIGAIEAYGQTCWEDVRTGARNCEPMPSGIPSPSPGFDKGDVNHDGGVNKDDALMILSNFLKVPSEVSGYYDPVGDNKINGMDFGWVIKDW